MKKYILYTVMICVFVLLISVSAFAAESGLSDYTLQNRQTAQHTGTSVLPANLKVIDDEAFAGTAMADIRLPENISFIGEEAFANNKELQFVFFLQDNLDIANTAFSGSNPILAGFNNSDAQRWARKNGFRYHIAFALTTNPKSDRCYVAKTENINTGMQETEKSRETVSVTKKARRTGRIMGELKATRYKGIAAVHIQSRYFP